MKKYLFLVVALAGVALFSGCVCPMDTGQAPRTGRGIMPHARTTTIMVTADTAVTAVTVTAEIVGNAAGPILARLLSEANGHFHA